MPEKEDIEALEAVLKRAQDVRTTKDGKPYLVIAHNDVIRDVEHLLPSPSRKIGNPQFIRSASFNGYVNEQKTLNSRLYVTALTTLVAVLDHHTEDPQGPQWGQHRATLTLKESPEYVLWKKSDKVGMSQRAFAQFIEDNSAEVQSPTGAELLDLVRHIKASQSYDCTGDIEEKPGNAGGTFVLSTKTKAGAKSELELPGEFGLGLSVYEGGFVAPIVARLRFEVKGEGKLTLWYELQKIQRFEQSALETIVSDIEKQTSLKAWYGTP